MRSLNLYTHKLAVVALLLVAFFALGIVDMRDRTAFTSSEVHFTDESASGLAIMPASCASNPAYYHSQLQQISATDYVAYTGEWEVGAYKHGVYICVTNNTGADYFIPGGSAAELNAVKALTVWTYCANEGQTCSFSGTKAVRYGANGAYAYGTHTNSVTCNNGTFGDPIQGTAKTCSYAASVIPGLTPF